MSAARWLPALRSTLSPSSRAPFTLLLPKSQHASLVRRSISSTSKRLQDAAPVPPKKPVGGFRGGLIGFLLGSTLVGASLYYYILEEYKISNDMLTSDIYAVQATVQQTHSYVTELENKIAQLEKKMEKKK